MSKLSEMLANGTVKPEDLVEAQDLVERAVFVEKALAACKKTLVFPMGEREIICYDYTDSAGERNAWGKCTSEGKFSCYSNWGGNHLIGQCNLFSFKEVYMAFDNEDFAGDLKRFLEEQIKKNKEDDDDLD